VIPEGFSEYADPGPFLSHVGPLYERDGVFALRVQEWHLNSDESAHGGLLASLADFSVGRAVRAEAGSHAVTVSLTCDYLGPAALGDWVEARTRVSGQALGGQWRCTNGSRSLRFDFAD